MVVNGSSEADWPEVLRLAKLYPALVLPSFGYHPWYVAERSPHWRQHLEQCLLVERSAVGEIGLDRWKPGLAYDDQEETFLWQLSLAAEHNLPVSIHCLKAWGRLHDLLRASARPARGFLLHSYGGPKEMVKPLSDLGAYFSLPGFYAHERKEKQRATFRAVPLDRLLLETDAPDQPLPRGRSLYSVPGNESAAQLNHPANLRAVYEFAAELYAMSLEDLAGKMEANFHRLFGGS
jgi:TatD DNase family protein